MSIYCVFFFFFQAEDGIRDLTVTGVQTVLFRSTLSTRSSPRCSAWDLQPSTLSRRRWSWTGPDRKSTRLNSSHSQISYAVFCLKKKSYWRKTPAVKRLVVWAVAYRLTRHLQVQL